MLFSYIFLIFHCAVFVTGLFEQCNHIIDLKAAEKILISSPFYPNPYPAGTSCRYTLKAPIDYQLDLKCDIDIKLPAVVSTAQLNERCYDEIFYFNREGSEFLSGSEYFCGSGSMERKSFLNRAVISYISMQPMRWQVGSTKVGVPGGLTVAAAGVPQKNHHINKIYNKNNISHAQAISHHTDHATNTSRPSQAAVQSELGNAFTHLIQLLSNRIETGVFIAPPPIKKHKNTKRPNNRRKAVKPTPKASTTTQSTDFSTFSAYPLLQLSVTNDSNTLNSVAATTIDNFSNTTPVMNSSNPDLRILSSNSPSYNEYLGAGNGRFSCIVEAVAAECDCGWSAHMLKVVSPSGVAGVNEYVSMAGVLTIEYGKIFCGAVIIHHRFLLSAAHCFMSAATNRSSLIQVVVGEHDLSTAYESIYTSYYSIDALILHENFLATATHVLNDIALLRTNKAIEWNRGVAPACLPFRSFSDTAADRKPPLAGQQVETAGWGSISFGGPQSLILLRAQLDVIGAEECRNALGVAPPATFCTYTPGRDTCQYDSGGGLYMRDHGRLYVVGIVSYGYGCAARQPSVNTKVASHLLWIRSHTPLATYCLK
ncbi:venom serine protease 34 [Eurosta solidaginis]|uniref:venom serine protease 34 n=1 Tax=Eurosta solidaginis TaxID=178769 RepID=UPI0035317C06